MIIHFELVIREIEGKILIQIKTSHKLPAPAAAAPRIRVKLTRRLDVDESPYDRSPSTIPVTNKSSKQSTHLRQESPTNNEIQEIFIAVFPFLQEMKLALTNYKKKNKNAFDIKSRTLYMGMPTTKVKTDENESLKLHILLKKM